MRIVCYRCKKELGNKPSSIFDNQEISHGLCEDCFDDLMEQIGIPLSKFLDDFPIPIVTIDKETKICDANHKALSFLKTEQAAAVGRLPGEVFECQHSKEPKGCGRTIHCSGCTLRQAINRTVKTGLPQVGLKAFEQHPDVNPEKLVFISSELQDGVIYLRFLPVDPEIMAKEKPSS